MLGSAREMQTSVGYSPRFTRSGRMDRVDTSGCHTLSALKYGSKQKVFVNGFGVQRSQ
jgi:hypothetical protein